MSEFATYEVSIEMEFTIEIFRLFTITSMVPETRRFERPSRITNVATERNNPEDWTTGITFPAHTLQQKKTKPCSVITGKHIAYYWFPIFALVNLLKPTGHVMHQQFNIQQLYVLPTLYLSENKQRLVPLTS